MHTTFLIGLAFINTPLIRSLARAQGTRLQVQKLRHVFGRREVARTIPRALHLSSILLQPNRECIPSTPHDPHNLDTLLSIILIHDLPVLPSVTITRRGNAEHRRGNIGLLKPLCQPNQLGDTRRHTLGNIVEQCRGDAGVAGGPRVTVRESLQRCRVRLRIGSRGPRLGLESKRGLGQANGSEVASTRLILDAVPLLDWFGRGYDGGGEPRATPALRSWGRQSRGRLEPTISGGRG